MNLYGKIIRLYREWPFEWNYYKEALGEPFNASQAKDFIQWYVQYGGNGMVISPLDEVDSMRISHVISSFFLGLLIQQKICPDLEIRSGKYADYKFSYLWFLVCLFHDIGHLQENDWTYKYIYSQQAREYLRKCKSVKGDKVQRYIYEDLGLLYVAPSIYKSKQFSIAGSIEQEENKLGICFNNGIEIQRAMYSRETILHYLEYCKMDKEIRHYDHGIVGGLWLYDYLMKNYNMQYQNEKLKNINAVFDDFVIDGKRHFSGEQRKIFAYLADCLISHNIRPADVYTNEKYKKIGLEELTREKFSRIGFRDNPILFILDLVDAIEPIKIYSSYLLSEKEIWRGIDVNVEEGSLILKVLDERLPFEKLSKKVMGIDSWLAVNLYIDTRAKEIKIHF